ncbi:cytosolic sulfotransferase 3-like [Takifugu rubripes]|uniref:cytosolic sulfotransferase 3-like n=1 Tax=Takifugu rubripes TaxID=31033 RepID=UPI0011452C2A|nr:cytosolic sulfotransferase 3-like [Takifugu rubripes]
MDLPPRPELFDFHGISMTHYFTSNWENIQKFQARPDDVFIASYPKAGNTWLCYILDLLYFGPTSMSHHERVPNLEITIPSRLTGYLEYMKNHAESMQTSPRLIRTHLPVHLIPKSVWEKNCRIVYVARNAKDSVVSYYHFERMTVISPEPGDWDSYLKRVSRCGSPHAISPSRLILGNSPPGTSALTPWTKSSTLVQSVSASQPP